MFFDEKVLHFSIAYVKNVTKTVFSLAFKIIYSNYANLGSTEKITIPQAQQNHH